MNSAIRSSRGMSMKVASTILAGALLLATAACTRMPDTSPEDVIGTWTYSPEESAEGMPGPPAEIELHADSSLVMRDFPLIPAGREYLNEELVTSEGTWKLLDKSLEIGRRYEDQSGVELLFTTPKSFQGTKTAREIAIEKDDDGTVRLVLYVGFPDIVDDKYVLTKSQ